ncbi:MAG: hypothetical protein PHU06_02500 [Gallionella sp.]|nr:hypothetical protein [Gallionella sp.]MDD4959007.1 hypothetical protein [Gallionella sp.]
MNPMRRERFESLVGYSRLPHAAAMSCELEWYASNSETILATILIDYEDEFATIILGRDADMRYRCIESLAPFQCIEDARKSMLNKSHEIILSGQKTFPQGDERGKKQDLFSPIQKGKKLNPNFEIVRTCKGYSSAKEIIAEAMHHYTDIDGNFIEQFQTSGFDSRLWELYLFAYLTEERLLVDRTHHAPDFLVSDGQHNVAIEAVTVQASQNSDAEDIDLASLTPEKIQELQKHYMPIKFGSPLYSKLKKQYWKMEHVKGLPLVFAIADFHAKQSMLWTSTALQNYLYGVRHEFHFSDNGQLVVSPFRVEFHEYNGKNIPSGFFFTENAEHISAVMFSSTGTISKFIRMGKLAGFGDSSVSVLYHGTCHKHDDNAALPDQFSFEINDTYEETWGEGISIFHNPRALYPLSREIFPSVAHHYMQEDGQIYSFLPEFHPYGGLTVMLHATDDLSSKKEESP